MSNMLLAVYNERERIGPVVTRVFLERCPDDGVHVCDFAFGDLPELPCEKMDFELDVSSDEEGPAWPRMPKKKLELDERPEGAAFAARKFSTKKSPSALMDEAKVPLNLKGLG